jgi:hypothetical protein
VHRSLIILIVLVASQVAGVAGETFYGVRILDVRKLTNSVLSDTVRVPFVAQNEVGMMRYAMLKVDGRIFHGDGAMLSAPLKNRAAFEMDTCFLENGRHTLQIQAAWSNLSLTNLDDREFQHESDVITITVSNEVYYPGWEPEVGERVSAYFFRTTRTNVDWHLDIYDSRKRFVQRLSGHTIDGNIEAYWDLKDAKGVLRTNSEADPEFGSTLTVDDPAGKRKVIKK